MLPTEDKVVEGSLISRGIDRMLAIANCLNVNDKNASRDSHSSNYLYILSDDEIKAGDWIHKLNTNRIEEALVPDLCLNKAFKKIIATTDPKLKRQGELNINKKFNYTIPQIPQLLVEYYAKHQPEYVELEYNSQDMIRGWEVLGTLSQLKLQDNEVVWVEPKQHIQKCGCEICGCTPLTACIICGEEKNLDGDFWKSKEKLYTRAEVEKLFADYETAHRDEGEDREQWLEDNL